MFSKLSAFWDLFRKGQEISNAEAWKKGTISVSALSAFLYAIVKLTKGTQYEVPLDESSVEAFSGAVLTLAATVMHIVTSKKAGILPAKPTGEALPELAEASTISAPQEVVIEERIIKFDK
jgi:hypothetical protein